MLVSESLSDFTRGIDPKESLKLGKSALKDTTIAKDYVMNRANELESEGFTARFQFNEYNEGIYEIHVAELMAASDGYSYMVSFLTWDERKWFDKNSELWGWGIWNEDTGETLLEAGLDWETVKKKIYELARK